MLSKITPYPSIQWLSRISNTEQVADVRDILDLGGLSLFAVSWLQTQINLIELLVSDYLNE